MNGNAPVSESCLFSYFGDVLCSKMFLKITIACEKCKKFYTNRSNTDPKNGFVSVDPSSSDLDNQIVKLKDSIASLIQQHENSSDKADFYTSNINFLHEIATIIDNIFIFSGIKVCHADRNDDILTFKYINERIFFISRKIIDISSEEEEIQNAMDNLQSMLKDLCEFEIKFPDSGLLSSIFAPLNKCLKDESQTILNEMQYRSDVYNFLCSGDGEMILDSLIVYIKTSNWEFISKLDQGNNPFEVCFSLKNININVNTISDEKKQKIKHSLIQLAKDKVPFNNFTKYSCLNKITNSLQYSAKVLNALFNLLQLYKGNIDEQKYDQMPEEVMHYDYKNILFRFIEQISYIAYDDFIYNDQSMTDFMFSISKLIKIIWDRDRNIIKNVTLASIFRPMLINDRSPFIHIHEGLKDALLNLDEISSDDCTSQKIISINGLTINKFSQR